MKSIWGCYYLIIFIRVCRIHRNRRIVCRNLFLLFSVLIHNLMDQQFIIFVPIIGKGSIILFFHQEGYAYGTNDAIKRLFSLHSGARCACYSADLLLRQYKRIRDKMKNDFSYKDIRNVYLIVLFEKSPAEFQKHGDEYYHYGKISFDTGLNLDMLQEYILIPLDIFKKCMHNKNINTKLDAWLTFFSEDRPDKIIELLTEYPQFKAMYQTIYDMCLNTERVMEMFSKELRELDRNTVKYMVEEQQRIIEEKTELIERQSEQIEQQSEQITQLSDQIAQLTDQLAFLTAELAKVKK